MRTKLAVRVEMQAVKFVASVAKTLHGATLAEQCEFGPSQVTPARIAETHASANELARLEALAECEVAGDQGCAVSLEPSTAQRAGPRKYHDTRRKGKITNAS